LKIIQQVVISRSHNDFIQEVVVILFNKLPWSYSYSKVTVILLFQSYSDLNYSKVTVFLLFQRYSDLIIPKLQWSYYLKVTVILFRSDLTMILFLLIIFRSYN